MFIWEIICVKIGKDKYKGAAKMKKIKWLATGGTISSVETEKGLVPASSDEQMKRCLRCWVLLPKTYARSSL